MNTRHPQGLPAASSGSWNLIRTPARHSVRPHCCTFLLYPFVQVFESCL